MTTTLRRANQRGHANHGWLDTYHTFSFANYRDPDHMGFRALRVINEDVVLPGQGFGTHPHQDMEIVTVVLEGALEHKDSLGSGSVIRPGDVQRMSAGTGIMHSEFNHSQEESVHLLQIWILPEKRGIAPGYEQVHFPRAERTNRLRVVASRDAREGSLTIHQDAAIYVSILEPGREVTHDLGAERHAWIQVTAGTLELEGQTLEPGDGASVSGVERLELSSQSGAEFILFDLA